MDIIRVVGIGMVTLFLINMIKQYRPEFAIYISILAGILIFYTIMPQFYALIDFINNISDKTGLDNELIKIVLKITGIAYITEFASSICRDSGETSIASKVEFGGKILIVTFSVPVFGALLEVFNSIM